jgi:hypothetical protein
MAECTRRAAGWPLFCIIDGPTRGRPWSSAAVRTEFRRLSVSAGVRRRFAPHQLRHAHALELAREGVPLNIIQRQLGHANLGTTSIYLQGIDPEEIIATVHMRRAPMMSASAGFGSDREHHAMCGSATALPPDEASVRMRRPRRVSVVLRDSARRRPGDDCCGGRRSRAARSEQA